MRNQLLFSGTLAAIMALQAHSQSAGQAAGNQGTHPVQGLPPGPQQEQLPPGLQRRAQTPLVMDTNLLTNPSRQLGIGSNQFTIGTNSLGIGSNELGFREWATNQFGRLSNALPVTPTGREDTPHAFATNGVSVTNRTRVTFQDRAYTVADQKLLLRLRQIVQPTAQSTEPLVPSVHFISREGVVTLAGFVPTEAERSRVEDLVRQTPGVVQVIDQLQVTTEPNTTLNGQFQGGTTQLGMSSSNQFGIGTNMTAAALGINSIFGISTNLTPTGRSNAPARIFGTENLPPELQQRQQPPQ